MEPGHAGDDMTLRTRRVRRDGAAHGTDDPIRINGINGRRRHTDEQTAVRRVPRQRLRPNQTGGEIAEIETVRIEFLNRSVGGIERAAIADVKVSGGIKRNADGLTADAMRYGGWKTAADAAPTSANFVLRARLIKFDTKNNVPNADGWLYYAIGSAIDSKTDAIATIA